MLDSAAIACAQRALDSIARVSAFGTCAGPNVLAERTPPRWRLGREADDGPQRLAGQALPERGHSSEGSGGDGCGAHAFRYPARAEDRLAIPPATEPILSSTGVLSVVTLKTTQMKANRMKFGEERTVTLIASTIR